MRLKHLLLIIFLFLSVFPIVFIGITDMHYYNGKMKTIIENDLRVAASTQAKAIENFYEERDTDLTTLAHSEMTHELLALSNEHNIQSSLEIRKNMDDILQVRAKQNRYLESITILDKDFKVVACSTYVPAGHISTLKDIDTKYFNHKTKFTKMLQRNTTGQNKRIVAAIKEIYERESIIGYIVEEINLDFFEAIRTSSELFNNGTIYLVDDAGQLITAGDNYNSRDDFVLSKQDRGGFSEAWNQEDPAKMQGLLHYKVFGQTYFSSYIKIANVGWTMIATINVDEVLESGEGYRDLIFLIAVMLIILFFSIQFLISHKLIKPMQTMIEKFNEIKKTQNYSIRMDIVPGSEIGSISTEINSLLQYIENDINRQIQKQKSLKEKADKDSLTGLYNKKYINTILEQELKKAQQEKRPIAYLFLDVDDFKQVNTSFGHIGGDTILCFLADCLKKIELGIAGRVGGDEFVICIRDIKKIERIEEEVLALLTKLNSGIVLEPGSRPVPIHVSIGVAIAKTPGLSFETLLKRADEAMYDVKHNKKNSYIITAY